MNTNTLDAKDHLLTLLKRTRTPLEIQARDLVHRGIQRVLVFKETETGCVELFSTLAKNSDGYSIIQIKGTQLRLHRLIYLTAFPDTPLDLHILHSCDNTSCCRLDHLFAGTHEDNMKDKERKGRGISKLSALQVKAIREIPYTLGLVNRLAKQYKVSHQTIGRIRNNSTYKVVI